MNHTPGCGVAVVKEKHQVALEAGGALVLDSEGGLTRKQGNVLIPVLKAPEQGYYKAQRSMRK